MSEAIAHRLERISNYHQGAVDQNVRTTLKEAAAVLRAPAAARERDFGTLGDLITLMADPAAGAKRLADLRTTGAEADAARLAAENAAAELDAKRAAFESEAAEHQRKLSREAGRHEAAMRSREAEIAGREKNTAELLAQAKADAAAAAALKSDLEQRLAQISEIGRKSAAA